MPRSSLNGVRRERLLEIYNEIFVATVKFYSDRDFRTIHCPLITRGVSSPIEVGSDSLPISIKIKGRSTFLIDSAQFYLEAGCRIHKRGCFAFLPSFRGDRPDKTHLSQFSHSEAEIVGSFDDAIELAESYVRHLCIHLLNRSPDLVRKSAGTVSHLESLIRLNRFPRITFDDCVKMVGTKGYIKNTKLGFRRLNRSGERKLMQRFGGIVWVTHMDHLSVPFYQAFADTGRKVSRTGDLLLGLGEVVGLGERHSSDAETKEALRLHKVNAKPYEWYLTMQRRAPLQTAGFGVGIERLICWLLNLSDIHQSVVFPMDLPGKN